MKFQANFPKVFYDYWDKPEIFPADARGPFRLRITAKLYIPADGEYCLYAKTEAPNRAKVFIETPARLTILYDGSEVGKLHNKHMVRISGLQKAGIQLFWSCDRHLTELVPAANLFH